MTDYPPQQQQQQLEQQQDYEDEPSEPPPSDQIQQQQQQQDESQYLPPMSHGQMMQPYGQYYYNGGAYPQYPPPPHHYFQQHTQQHPFAMPPHMHPHALPPHEYYFNDPVTISASNPYAHQLSMHGVPIMSGWTGASSLQVHSAQAAAHQLRQANASRNRRKKAKGFDEKVILSATKVIRCNEHEMSRDEQISTSAAAAAAGATIGVPSTTADNEVASVTREEKSEDNMSSITDATLESAEISPSLSLPSDISRHTTPAPSSTSSLSRYPTLYELLNRHDLDDCRDFLIQHGDHLPQLHVKYITDITACELREDGTTGENIANDALKWLLEDLDQDSDKIIGIDAEGRQIHLLQLATRSRCVLLKLPKYQLMNTPPIPPATPVPTNVVATNGASAVSTTSIPSASSAAAVVPSSSTTSLSPILPSPPSDSFDVPSDVPYDLRSLGGAPSFPIPPLLREILEDASIVKSGAELWGDALDIYRDLGICMNGGINMTKSFTSVLSLEVMTNLALSADKSTIAANAGGALNPHTISVFKKDRTSTTSAWDADHLTLRQLVYAALDAQTSYFIGKNLKRPPPFNLSEMSQPWVRQAGAWLLMSKFMESAQEKELRASFEDMSFGEQGISVLMNQYNKRIRLGSDVTVHLSDGTKVACLVTGVNGKRADLQWENADDILGKEDIDIERITLTRKWEDTLLPKPVRDYLQSEVHGESENHPIVNALLSRNYDGPDIADPSLVTNDLTTSSTTLHSISSIHNPQHVLPPDLLAQQWIRNLNESQQYAVALAINNQITIVEGSPGTGKCWATGTKLMMYDGSTKTVETIVEGDRLMGDDSTPRIVQKGSLITGESEMYEITSVMGGRKPWRCNAEHILVLRWCQHPSSITLNSLQQWEWSEFMLRDDRVIYHTHTFLTESAAQRSHDLAVKHFAPLIWECSVLHFLSLSFEVQAAATMYQPDSIIFEPPLIDLKTRMQSLLQRTVTPIEISEAAYELGRLLVGGNTAEPSSLHPQLLEHYSTLDSLMRESLDIRRSLLAGVIATSIKLNYSARPDTIIREYLCPLKPCILSLPADSSDSVIYLARSLGYLAHSNGDSVVTMISPSSSNERGATFAIKSVGIGLWHGFMLDGNSRLLMDDFVVTHNTSTIAAIVRTLICDPSAKILCVARTNTAARHMASACAKFLGPNKLTLQVSQEFLVEWHEEFYTDLLYGGYVHGLPGQYGQLDREHQVLVLTTGITFTKPELTQGRTVVILDEGSQIWDLEALLFLRAMDCLESIIIFGDSKQLSCYVSPEWRVAATSILDLASLAATRARIFPQEWARTGLITVQQCMLNTQYRMVSHLGSMISNFFYDGVLRSADTSTVRAVTWIDVRGFSQADEQFSVYNLAEVDEVIRLWRHLCGHGYRPDEIVIISMYDAMRQKLAETGVISTARIYNVDSFQGQESPIVILVLANNVLTDFLKDSRRINVACSRAQQRLYIVGDLSTFSAPEAGVWSKIAAYAVSEYKPTLDVPLMSDADFPTLGGNGSVASSPVATPRPTSSWSSAAKPAIKAVAQSASKSVTKAVAANNSASTAVTPSKPTAASIVASHVNGTASKSNAPSTPQANTNPMSRLSQASLSSPVSTPKLTSKAAPFFPSKSASEFVPKGEKTIMTSTVTEKGAWATSLNVSPRVVPHGTTAVTINAAPITLPVAVAVASQSTSGTDETTIVATAAPTTTAVVTNDNPSISSTPTKPVALTPTPAPTPVIATSTPAAPMSFAARVAAAAAASTPKAHAATPATTIPTQTPATVVPLPNATPVPTPSKPTLASRVAAANATPIKSKPSNGVPPSSAARRNESSWCCSACSFCNTTAQRFCEVCQTVRT